MRKVMLSFNLVFLAFLLGITGGCTRMTMNAVIDSWQDRQVSEVLAVWGNPSEQLNLEGKQLFIWNTYDGKPAPADTKRASNLQDSRNCVRLLKADRKGKIIEGAWDGNGCPSWFSGWTR